MAFKRFAGLQNWKDLALGVAWKGGAGTAKINNPNWRIEESELSDLRMLWPLTYEWPNAERWVDPLLIGFAKHLKVERTDIAQPFPGTVLFQIIHRGQKIQIAIDYFDLATINQEAAAESAVYFKMQFARGGYPQSNIFPGGYAPDSRKLYLYLSSLRRTRAKQQFHYEVYGRFSLDYAKDRRRDAIEILTSQKRFAFEGGLTKVGYVEFLRQVAHSKICIDLPGNGDFCHRLINYFAVGACVIGPRHGNELHVPLVDRKHIAFAKDDLSDLVDLCVYYLENDDEREEMCLASQRYFDQYLHRDNLSEYYLRTILDHLAAPPA